MLSIRNHFLQVSLGLLLLFQSCETEIDIIAPQRDVTIIYGLLEADRFRHFIRINKILLVRPQLQS